MSFLAHTAAKIAWQVLVGSSRQALVRGSLGKDRRNRKVKESFGSKENCTVTDPHEARAESKIVDHELSWAELRPTIANVPQAREYFPTVLRSWAELRPRANYTPPTINDE
jgi:hypothetical protein